VEFGSVTERGPDDRPGLGRRRRRPPRYRRTITVRA